MSRKRLIKLLVAFAVLLILVFIVRALVSNGPVGEKVAVIDINGAISKSDKIIELIHQYRDNGSVKAIVVRIDSRGVVLHRCRKYTAN